MDLKRLKVLVVGAGKTGRALVTFLVRQGARVTVNDRKHAAANGFFSDAPVKTVWGGHPEELFLSMDLIVLSPGVPLQIPAVQKAIEKGIPVIGELELASRFLSLPIIAVTGTNGKTTTTTVTGEILKNAGLRPFVGGNIGRPLIEACLNPQAYRWAVLEVSSFQLATAPHFHPKIAAILNIEPDHLDWHPTLEDYTRAKWGIARNMMAEDSLVLYAPLLSRRPTDVSCELKTFTEADDETHTAFIRGGELHWKMGEGDLSLPIRDLRVRHLPFLLDMLAGGLLALAAGVPGEVVLETLSTFESLPHRIEPVGDVNGVRFVNDSKATNVDAVLWALKSQPGNLIWLAGGLWKGGDLEVLSSLVAEKVKALVAFGESGEMFQEAFRAVTRVYRVPTLEEAVAAAYRLADSGDTVLLSPACASFDQFENYKERGRAFASAVKALSMASRRESHVSAQ